MNKNLLPLVAGLAFLLCLCAQATVPLPYYDAFNYAEGSLNVVGSPNWVVGSGTSFEIAISNAAALTAPAGFPAATGKGLRRAPSSSSKRSVLQFTSVPAVDGNAVFVSFLLDVQTAPGAAQLIGHLDDVSTSDSTPQAGIFLDAGPKIGLGKNVSSPGFTMATNLGAGPHLIVVRYLFQAGNDRVDLWVDPASTDYGAVTPPASLGSTTGSTDPGSLDFFQFITSSTAGGAQFIDEFRAGTTWAAVVPSSGPPVGQKLGFTTQPADTTPGTIMNAVVVQVQTSAGAAAASNNVPITLILSSGSGSLGGTTTRNTDASGAATFNDLTIDTAGTAKQFTASASGIGAGLAGASSSSFAITNVAVVVTNTLPVITQIQLTPYGIAIRGNNGPSNGVYRVVNATNATLPRGQWAVIATNAFDAAGNFACTNPFALNSSARFYCLLLGGQLSVAPSITTQPQNQSVIVSNSASFSVLAAGSAPLRYQWYFNTNTPLANATNDSFTLLTAQFTNAGGYSVIVTNPSGAVTSLVAVLTVNPAPTNLDFSLYGFAQTDTGGGILAETSPLYRKVTNALDLANAIDTASIKVIEIMTNLDLGWLEIGAAAQAVGPFRIHATPSLHPRLLQTGVSLLDIQSKDGLTIFSANGATIKHCCFNIKNARNIIVRNLKFDELWEWDEATKGNYDSKDWDFIDLGNGGGTGTTTNIWIDHCTFTKAYDGICDIKGGANHITLSWNRYVGDDSATNPNSFVWQQINTLESNKTAYAMYNSLRTASGFTPAEIVTIIQGHDKTHLAGANSGVGAGNEADAAANALISITFHHQWFQNCWDRCVPRLRGGNVHSFNIYADDSLALDAKRLRDAHGVNSSYNFNPVLNGSIATESGAILVENSIYQDCLTPLRNNQTDVNNPAYTGKIMALNSIYSFRTTGGPTNTYTGSSTNAPGDTYFGPVQAPVIAFSWNLPGNVLPYSYSMTDPNQLKSVLTNATTGCGAGVLTWAKTNWLKTSY